MTVGVHINPAIVAQAKRVWEETIDKLGRPVELYDQDDQLIATVKAFAKRPKILGQFDRTQASYDQEKYMLLINAKDLPNGVLPEKFMRARWDDEDHVMLSTTDVDLTGVIYGYRIIVKG